MKKTAIALSLTLVLLSSLLTTVIIVGFTAAQSVDNIKINKDGSVTPSTAPINRTGNLYTLNSDIFGSIIIEKSSIVLDGSGHSINASSSFAAIASKPNPPLFGEYLLDITIRNFVIVQAGYIGIFIQDTNNSIIYNNTISNVEIGIQVDIYGSDNTVIGNNLTNISGVGIWIWTSNNTISANSLMNCGSGIYFSDWAGNTVRANHIENNGVGINCFAQNAVPDGLITHIYYNSFVNNTIQFLNQAVVGYSRLVNVWDNGTVGNFWSDYNGADANGDGIGDTPYYVDYHTPSDANDTDNYPLMMPIILEVPHLPLPTLTPTPTATLTPQPTYNPTNTPSPSPSPTPSALTTVSAKKDNGTTVDLTLIGNITNSQMTNVVMMTNQSESTTTLSFTLTGQSGTTGFSNITIPKNSLIHGTTPKIYVDVQPATNQGYTQDSSNYHVWYTTHFSSHQVSIIFTMPVFQSPAASNGGFEGQVRMLEVVYGLIGALAVVIVVVIALRVITRSRRAKAGQSKQV